jgi:hypothetical protein
MSLSGIQIQGGITISGRGVYMGLGSGTPSLTLSPTDFNAGTFSGLIYYEQSTNTNPRYSKRKSQTMVASVT